LPDFSWSKYTKWKNYAKWPKNYTKWPSDIPNDNKIHSEAPPHFTKLWIFRLKLNHLATPAPND
jgi:hypothetical protein